MYKCLQAHCLLKVIETAAKGSDECVGAGVFCEKKIQLHGCDSHKEPLRPSQNKECNLKGTNFKDVPWEDQDETQISLRR